MSRVPTLAVILEQGGKRVFACARDWPGWCRSGRTDEAALAVLVDYAARYATVTAAAGIELPAYDTANVEVIERVPGSATTDFGAPGSVATWDRAAPSDAEADRLAALVQASWSLFDTVAAAAPAMLRKGPRGGGRDRDAIVEHVVGAEAAYARKVGVRRPAPKAVDREAVDALRAALLDAIRHPQPGAGGPTGWPARYAARRVAWHALDHAWEIEDRGR